MKKEDEYAQKILSHMAEIFQEECENHISMKDLSEGKNATHFIHAMSNIVPTIIYKKITGADTNNLDHNHIANTPCFQYSNKK